MNNKSEMVSVPRELTPEMRKAIWGTQHDTCENTWRAVLAAAPAEDVRAVVDEPVAWIVTDMNGDSYFAYDKQTPADHPLYRHPQRPVVMPERRNVDPYNAETVLQWHKDREWNACLDEFSRLNPEISK